MMSKTILLVEDDPGISACAKLAIINKLPYKLVHVWDGLEALDYLRNNRNAVSLILLDLNMPRMDGLKFLSVIKADHTLTKTPVILQTAATNEEVQAGLELGADLYLPKPYSAVELYVAIIKVFAEKLHQQDLILALHNHTDD
jgi:CheY-like chemotaxis protein